jgi:hypothetical protein
VKDPWHCSSREGDRPFDVPCIWSAVRRKNVRLAPPLSVCEIRSSGAMFSGPYDVNVQCTRVLTVPQELALRLERGDEEVAGRRAEVTREQLMYTRKKSVYSVTLAAYSVPVYTRNLVVYTCTAGRSQFLRSLPCASSAAMKKWLADGRKLPGSSSRVNSKNGRGFPRKKSIENMACGFGRLYCSATQRARRVSWMALPRRGQDEWIEWLCHTWDKTGEWCCLATVLHSAAWCCIQSRNRQKRTVCPHSRSRE